MLRVFTRRLRTLLVMLGVVLPAVALAYVLPLPIASVPTLRIQAQAPPTTVELPMTWMAMPVMIIFRSLGQQQGAARLDSAEPGVEPPLESQSRLPSASVIFLALTCLMIMNFVTIGVALGMRRRFEAISPEREARSGPR